MEILTDKFGVGRTFVQPSIYYDSQRVINFFKCSEDTILENIIKSI